MSVSTRNTNFLMRIVLAAAILCPAAFGTDFKTIEPPPPGYHHDRFNTEPDDIVRTFKAYITSFDGPDDNDGDGTGDNWRIPEWVAYELRRAPEDLGDSPDRPSPWITDKDLHDQKIAPDDDSYKNSGYDRGHMCMKHHAFRLGAAADWNTHTVLNACPQKHCMNAGAWLALENKTAAWADKYGKVWIIAGPVIFNHKPHKFIGDGDELKVVVPDAFFKIVVKDGDDGPDVLAFLIPQEGVPESGSNSFCSPNHDLTPYLTSVDVIEALTELDFLTALPDDEENRIEACVYHDLWPE